MESKKKKISISVAISVLTLIASFLSSFLFTKFLLSQSQIGDINYGLKTTADSFVSFVSVFTLGMSSTFIRFHKKYKDDEESVVSSFNLITSIISLLAIIFGIVLFVLTANNIILNPNDGVYSEQQVHDFSLIILISISYTALSIILGNSKWFLESEKHIVAVRLVNLIVTISYPLLSTIFVLLGANMVAVTLIYSIIYLAGFLFYLFYRIKITKSAGFLKIDKLKKSLIKEILFFSIFVLITSGIETFNHSVDKMFLTISISASLTTIYQLSITLNQILLSLSDLIYAPFLPFIADDLISNNQKGVQGSYDKVNLILLFLSFLLLAGFASCGNEFVILWVGEGKELVYYFTVILFAVGPLYGMVKFTNSIQRLAAKHYKSSILFIISFAIHLVITASLIWSIGIWACIIGIAVSYVFLGISFGFYNKKYLNLKQKNFCFSFLRFAISAAVSFGVSFLVSFILKNQVADISNVLLFLIEGVISVVCFLIISALLFWKNTVDVFKRIFSDNYSQYIINKPSIITRISNKLSSQAPKIYKLFPYIFIIYFLLNFASYYLGGISFIESLISSQTFSYISKLLSYLVLLTYGLIFILANKYKFNFTRFIGFSLVFLISVIGSFLIPKLFVFTSANEYGWIVQTTISIGIFDLIISNLNYLIDLIVLCLYLFIFRKAINKNNLLPFMRFIVVFALLECVYSLIFQYNDYLYFFSKVTNDTSFGGYETNISGTFLSKNGFGFLLFQSIIACVFLLINKKLINKYIYLAPFIVLNVVNIFSLCKTSTISALLFCGLVFILYLVKIATTKKKTFIVLVCLSSSFVLLFALCFTPLFREINFIDSMVKKFIGIFAVSGDATIKSRIVIWEYSQRLLNGPFAFFGYGKSASADFLYAASNLNTHTFHNGILDIFFSFGIAGLVLYIFSIYTSYKKSTYRLCFTFDKIIIIATIIGTLSYGLMENVVLLMTSSSIVLVPNLLLSVSYNVNQTAEEEREKEITHEYKKIVI